MALETTTELRNFMQDEVGDTNASTATQTRFVELLNSAHLSIVSGGLELNKDKMDRSMSQPFIFPWALSSTPLIVNTVAPIDTGTISVTNNSTSATLSASQATSLAGWYIRIGEDEEVYRIAAHTGGTDAITLDAAYVSTTNATATYKAFKLDYAFGSSDLLLPTGVIRSRWGEISIVDANEMEQQYPLNDVDEGNPTLAGLVSQGDYAITVRLSHYTESAERLTLPYVAKPAALDTSTNNPILPKHHRKLVAYLATFYELRANDDDRALSYFKTAQDLFVALKAESRKFNNFNDQNFGRILSFPGGFGTLRGSSRSDHPNKTQY